MATPTLGVQVRRLVALLAETAGTRIDLARLEMTEWRGHWARVLVFSIGASLSGFFAIQTLVIAILVECWDSCRATAAWSLAGAFGVALLICLTGLYFGIKGGRRFLPATLEVLREDLENLKNE